MAPTKKKSSHSKHGSHGKQGSRALVRRNADGIPADVLLDLAPIAPPVQAVSRPRPVKRKIARIAQALKPQGATVTKEHLLGVGAAAAGGIVTALAANELVDNVGVMPMAVGATVVGGLGSAFLKGNWQKLAQGMLGAGVGQLGTAYLAQRGLKKTAATAATVRAAETTATPAKRNGYRRDDDEPDDGALARAMARTERRIDAMLAAERNAAGDDFDDRLGERYGGQPGDFEPVFVG